MPKKCLCPKYKYIIHNNTSSSESVWVHPLFSSHFIHPYICLELFWTVLTCKQCLICAYFAPDSDEITFSLEKAILCIDDSTCILIDGLESCGLLVDYCDIFISCLDSHSDGTHSPQRIHWWTSDVMLNFLQICSDEETSSSTSCKAWGWVYF